jgi:hypothetical protein
MLGPSISGAPVLMVSFMALACVKVSVSTVTPDAA